MTGQSVCTTCPSNRICPRKGTIDPEFCADGTVLVEKVCDPCPIGNFCINHKIIPCLPGGYCPMGSAYPTPCPIGFYGTAIGAAIAESCIKLPHRTECEPGKLGMMYLRVKIFYSAGHFGF